MAFNSDTNLASGSHPHSGSSFFPRCLSLIGGVHSAKWAFLGVGWGAPQKGHICQIPLEEYLQDIEGQVGPPFLSLGRWQHAGDSLSLGPGAAFEHLGGNGAGFTGRGSGGAWGQHHSREPLRTGQAGWD